MIQHVNFNGLQQQVIGVHDVANIYKVPLLLHQQNVLEMIVERLKLPHVDSLGAISLTPNMFQWTHLSNLYVYDIS